MASLAGLTVQRIAIHSPDYRAMLDLRHRVLRKPLGLTLSAADTSLDAQGDLLVAKLGVQVVGCCLLTLESPVRLQLRAMAVEPELQRQRIGEAVVGAAEARARERGAIQVELDARETAVGFYARLGYAVEGEPYTKVGIPHRRMRKHLG